MRPPIRRGMTPMRIQIKRVYDQPASADGRRILVDRLWPRGLSKAGARIEFWARSVAPSNDLRRWYGHDPARWEEFRRRYFAELDANPGGVAELRAHLGAGTVTLLFGSKETRLNNAAALYEYLKAHSPDLRRAGAGTRRRAKPARRRKAGTAR